MAVSSPLGSRQTAVAPATHRPLTAFFTGAATALGAGVSMAFSEGLSDTGDLTGRGRPVPRGEITGGGTFAAAGDRAPMPSENPSPTCIRGHNRQAPKLADTC
jgi:hypothetical protein